MNDGWDKDFRRKWGDGGLAVTGRPKATPQSQVDYMLKVLAIKNDQVEDLELQLRTAKLELQLKDAEVNKKIDSLERAWECLKNRKRDSETTKLTPSSKPSKTLKTFLSSSKLFTVLLISFFAVVGFLLALSLSPKMGL